MKIDYNIKITEDTNPHDLEVGFYLLNFKLTNTTHILIVNGQKDLIFLEDLEINFSEQQENNRYGTKEFYEHYSIVGKIKDFDIINIKLEK